MGRPRKIQTEIKESKPAAKLVKAYRGFWNGSNLILQAGAKITDPELIKYLQQFEGLIEVL